MSPFPANVRIHPTLPALHRAAADLIEATLQSALTERGRGLVALAGGHTPRAVYATIAEDQANGRAAMSWDRIHVFFGDERAVPPDDPASNYRMAKESLLAHLPLPAANVHQIPGELGAEAAAIAYAKNLQTFFDLPDQTWPQFDLVLLGLGDDGHTASLFPGTAPLEEEQQWVCANQSPVPPTARVTLTFPILNAARRVVFLVAGEAKAKILRQALAPQPGEPRLPAARVAPASGEAIWLVDAAAASLLAP